jgi:hypothetical protein
MSQSESREVRPAAGYSSIVRLFLLVNGQSHKLAQIGPYFVRLRAPAEIPPGRAEILMVVDGAEHRWQVTLKDGAVPFDSDLDLATSAA